MQTLGGADKAKGRKADNLRNEVAGLEAAVQAASQEYDRVKSRNTQVLTLSYAHTLAAVHVQEQLRPPWANFTSSCMVVR